MKNNRYTLNVKKKINVGEGLKFIHYGDLHAEVRESLNTRDFNAVIALQVKSGILARENYLLSLHLVEDCEVVYGSRLVKLQSDDGQIEIYLRRNLSLRESLFGKEIDWSPVFKELNQMLPISLLPGEFLPLKVGAGESSSTTDETVDLASFAEYRA